jgi:Flp pilus assembly protein TadD
MFLAAVFAAFSLAPAPAQAGWIKAESDRFIVYGEGGEAKVRGYLMKLATFDATLRRLNQSTQGVTPATKLQVVLVSSDLRRIAPNTSSGLAGFYTAREDGVFAFVETDAAGGDAVLFHEYTHHFMLENFPVAYPSWFVEGVAEYYMTAEITPKGVKIGGLNEGRAHQLLTQSWMSWDELLSKTTAETRGDKIQAFYAQSWLLLHFMRSTLERAQKLDAVINAINAGEAPASAFWKCTGWDARQLTKELKAYRRLDRYIVNNPLKSPPAITVTRLPQSADDLFLDRMRLYLRSRPDPAFLEQVRKRAGRHPGDALAELTLARAEFAMGDVGAGEAILRRRLAADPNDYETLIEAGADKLIAGQRDQAKRAEYFKASRAFFGKAYAQNKSDYRALYGYARGRWLEPSFPNDNDLNALMAARALAPSVTEISMTTGFALFARGRRDEAVKVLAPVANNPHGGGMAAFAKALIEGKSRSEADAAAKAIEGADDAPGPPPA